MRIRKLGRTGIQVSEFCLGLLPIGPLQLNAPEDSIAEIVRHALEGGVTFFDTAKGYKTEAALRKGLGSHTNDAVIATKSPAKDGDEMARDVEAALKELGRDQIDIFHLHAARDSDPFKNRAGALKRLIKFKEEKVIRAVGVATHFVNVTRAAAKRRDVDVLLAINNLTGMGVMGGTAEQMSEAMKEAADSGVGVYVMKPLAGGNLIGKMMEAIDYARNIKGAAAVALGVVSMDELKFDLRVFEDHPLTKKDYAKTSKEPKKYVILGGCKGCGTCVKTCASAAIEIVDKKARIDDDKCVRCGYCAGECPEFWIRVV